MPTSANYVFSSASEMPIWTFSALLVFEQQVSPDGDESQTYLCLPREDLSGISPASRCGRVWTIPRRYRYASEFDPVSDDSMVPHATRREVVLAEAGAICSPRNYEPDRVARSRCRGTRCPG